MDNARASVLDSTAGLSATQQGLGGCRDCEAALDVNLGEKVSSADLGGRQ